MTCSGCDEIVFNLGQYGMHTFVTKDCMLLRPGSLDPRCPPDCSNPVYFNDPRCPRPTTTRPPTTTRFVCR